MTQPRYIAWAGLLVTLVLLPYGRAALAQDSFADAFWQFRATAGVDYSSGKYGAPTTTGVIYSYVGMRAEKGPWILKVVVPWLSVSGPALLLDGRGSGTAGTVADRDVSGPGDITVSATYALEQFYDRELFVDFTVRLKIPTASFADGPWYRRSGRRVPDRYCPSAWRFYAVRDSRL